MPVAAKEGGRHPTLLQAQRLQSQLISKSIALEHQPLKRSSGRVPLKLLPSFERCWLNKEYDGSERLVLQTNMASKGPKTLAQVKAHRLGATGQRPSWQASQARVVTEVRASVEPAFQSHPTHTLQAGWWPLDLRVGGCAVHPGREGSLWGTQQ